MKSITSHLRTLLIPLQNGEAALWQTNYMRNQFPFLGVKTPLLRKVISELPSSKKWRSELIELWNEPEREFQYAAIFWAIKHRKEAKPQEIALYEKMILEKSWWDSVDTIAPHLVGALIHRYPELTLKTEEWLTSKKLWLMRSALIYPLFKRKEIDSERLFRYCKTLKDEKGFFIRKAIGWMLREKSKTDPKSVKEFIDSVPLSPLSKREGQKYI